MGPQTLCLHFSWLPSLVWGDTCLVYGLIGMERGAWETPFLYFLPVIRKGIDKKGMGECCSPQTLCLHFSWLPSLVWGKIGLVYGLIGTERGAWETPSLYTLLGYLPLFGGI